MQVLPNETTTVTCNYLSCTWIHTRLAYLTEGGEGGARVACVDLV